ncbi:RRXRR domain-containing protein [Candidatus Bathyarchaeota archaeon]|nr:RRXRR domain-containing protein [Candidatus Bathyarchaeota archaeon]
MRRNSVSNVNSPDTASKPLLHLGCGCNARKSRGLSPKHSVFVLAVDGKPLTPTTPCRAKRLMREGQAKPKWNKFGCFGIQMLVQTRREIPKTALGVDFGTKFEGYAVTVGNENNLSVMWKLPDKKILIKKLDECRNLRRARRQRNCRRREQRSDNRRCNGWLAPSQRLIVNSRLKCLQEFYATYPIDTASLEDVRFNHRDKRWGKNFSTVEVGKQVIRDFLQRRGNLIEYSGYETQLNREQFGYRKSSSKSAETFNSHCSDALALAVSIGARKHIPKGRFIVVDDTYRPIKRKLHYTQFTKGGIRKKRASGNFNGIKKGVVCNLGQICGGKHNNKIRTFDWFHKRIDNNLSKIEWLSHNFKKT